MVMSTAAPASALAAFRPAKPAPMTTTFGLLPCCAIGNIVAIPQPTYTAEGKRFRRRFKTLARTVRISYAGRLIVFASVAWYFAAILSATDIDCRTGSRDSIG